METAAAEDPVLSSALAHFGEVRGRRLLDLGCGTGAAALYFAAQGAQVTALDISSEAVNKLRAHCAREGIDNVEVVRGTAFDIQSLPPFDFVYGSMILHHIEPFDEFARVLRESVTEEGRGFFYENSAMSRLLIWFRTHVVGRLWVPKRGDADEFPLTPQEIDRLRRAFDVQVVYPELVFFRLIPSYIFRERGMGPFVKLDEWAFRFEGMRRYSYRQYLYLAPPT